MKVKRDVSSRPARSAHDPSARRVFLTDGKGNFIGLEILDPGQGRVIESNLVRAGTVLELPPGITWGEASRAIRGRTVLVPQELAGRILSDRSERPSTLSPEQVDPEMYEE